MAETPRPVAPPPEPPGRPRAPLALAALLWCTVTAVGLATTAWFYLANRQPGLDGLRLLVRAGPFSDPFLTLSSAAISWLLAGVLIGLLYFRRIQSRNVLLLAGFFCVSLLYVNVLRERLLYGDIQDYVQAAENLYHGRPLHGRYLYPPLWEREASSTSAGC
jgi:hypothetical protein